MYSLHECGIWNDKESAETYYQTKIDWGAGRQIGMILDYYKQVNPGWDPNDSVIPLVLDVACGSGQITVPLSKYCTKIIGIDVAKAQIDLAKDVTTESNVEYEVGSAVEFSRFCSPGSADLITVGMGAHYFDCDEFYNEVRKCLKPGGVIAILGKAIVGIEHSDKRFASYFSDFFEKAAAGEEVRHSFDVLADSYRSLYFPFKNIEHREYTYTTELTRQALTKSFSSSLKKLFKPELRDELLKNLPEGDSFSIIWKEFGKFCKI